MTRSKAAYTAFKKPDLVDDPYLFDTTFDDYNSRKLRYNIFWNQFGNSAYDNEMSHRWLQTYKTQFGLYRYIRHIYNPAGRIGDFWQAHIWGGPALEFKTKNDKIIDALAQIYRWSNWPTRKDIVTLYGPTMGDVGIRVRDDVENEQVYFEVVHPSAIRDKGEDSRGNVKAYILEEQREDPNSPDETVVFREEAIRDGDNVIYKTFLNDKLFPWNGEESEFSIPYGFVPMIFIKNIDVGGEWGRAELHRGMSKFREVDEKASMMNDQIRKIVDALWLITGMSETEATVSASKTKATEATLSTNPYPGREQTHALYAKNERAAAKAMVADLDLPAVEESTQKLMEEIEREYPELRLSTLTASGEASGRALRIARQPVAAKVETRRVNYDDALIRANMMALSIAGFRGYEGFPFDLGSFKKGDLDHTIKSRPVFTVDPMDAAEADEKKAQAENTRQTYLMHPTVTKWEDDLKGEGKSEEEVQEGLTRLMLHAQMEDSFGIVPQDEQQPGQQETAPQPAGDGDADTPINIEAAAGLNGAQIRAALDVLDQVIAGTLPVEVAEELLIAVGIEPARARKMAQLTAQRGKLNGFREEEGPPGQAPEIEQ